MSSSDSPAGKPSFASHTKFRMLLINGAAIAGIVIRFARRVQSLPSTLFLEVKSLWPG